MSLRADVPSYMFSVKRAGSQPALSSVQQIDPKVQISGKGHPGQIGKHKQPRPWADTEKLDRDPQDHRPLQDQPKECEQPPIQFEEIDRPCDFDKAREPIRPKGRTLSPPPPFRGIHQIRGKPHRGKKDRPHHRKHPHRRRQGRPPEQSKLPHTVFCEKSGYPSHCQWNGKTNKQRLPFYPQSKSLPPYFSTVGVILFVQPIEAYSFPKP